MSGYSKLNASPFWMAVLRITGILCLATLILPAAFVAKYAVFDAPEQARIARDGDPSALETAAKPDDVLYYIAQSRPGQPRSRRLSAIDRLDVLASTPGIQLTRPMETLRARIALEDLARTDRDEAVRAEAASGLARAALHGVALPPHRYPAMSSMR